MIVRGEKMSNTHDLSPRSGGRGGQPGNTNALRHGFYARNLGLESPTAIDETQMRNLLGEAAMLKDYMFKLYTRTIDSNDNAEIAETLRALSMASMALSRLLEVHCRVRVYESGILDSAEESLRETIASLNSYTQSIKE